MASTGAIIHSSAEVSDGASVGKGTRIWHQAQVRERASIGANCIIGKGVYVDFDVIVGDNVKIQNGAFLYHGLTIEDGVFIGPGVIFTNDKYPRAIAPDGVLKSEGDWDVGQTRVRFGASIGAGAIVLPAVSIGTFAIVGAGAVVSKDVADFSLVVGNPALHHRWVCKCARPLAILTEGIVQCGACGLTYRVRTVGETKVCECVP